MKNLQPGFTLIELLLYVGIFGTVIFAVAGFLILAMQSRVKNQTVAEVEQQGMAVMQILTQITRNASTINLPAISSSSGTLSVNVTAPANSPTVFDLTAGAIRMTEGAGTPVLLNNSFVIASALSFRNLSLASTPGTIRIQFILTHVNPAGRNEYNYQKTFYGTATLR